MDETLLNDTNWMLPYTVGILVTAVFVNLLTRKPSNIEKEDNDIFSIRFIFIILVTMVSHGSIQELYFSHPPVPIVEVNGETAPSQTGRYKWNQKVSTHPAPVTVHRSRTDGTQIQHPVNITVKFKHEPDVITFAVWNPSYYHPEILSSGSTSFLNLPAKYTGEKIILVTAEWDKNSAEYILKLDITD